MANQPALFLSLLIILSHHRGSRGHMRQRIRTGHQNGGKKILGSVRLRSVTSVFLFRTDSSGQVYNHQLQIRYRGLDLLSEWIDSFYQFDFKTNPNLIKELLAFVKDEVRSFNIHLIIYINLRLRLLPSLLPFLLHHFSLIFIFTLFQLILVDRSERGHYLMELISEKQKRDLNNNLSSDEPSDFVAVLQLEEPQGTETSETALLNSLRRNMRDLKKA